MNNTSKSNSKAKLICIIAGLLVVILAIVLTFTFISKLQQNKDTEITEIDTKQNESYEQQNVDKDIKTSVKDSTYGEAIPEEADQNSENIEHAGDMNGDTATGVEISEELREYNESPESQVTEEDNTAEWTEEPKQEDVYVPSAEPEFDNTPSTPEDSNNFWGETGNVFDDTPEGEDYGDDGWKANGEWNWQGADTNQNIDWDSSQDWMPEGTKQYEWH